MYSKGISWFDDGRIPFVNEDDFNKSNQKGFTPECYEKYSWRGLHNYRPPNSQEQGRFPPNLLISDDMLNDGSVSKSNVKEGYVPPNPIKKGDYVVPFNRGKHKQTINDKGTSSRYYDIDKWFDKLLD